MFQTARVRKQFGDIRFDIWTVDIHFCTGCFYWAFHCRYAVRYRRIRSSYHIRHRFIRHRGKFRTNTIFIYIFFLNRIRTIKAVCFQNQFIRFLFCVSRIRISLQINSIKFRDDLKKNSGEYIVFKITE